MFSSLRRRFHKGVQNRGCILTAIVLVTAVSCIYIPFIPFDGRIDVMLPDQSELQNVFQLLRDIQVADKVLVTFSMRDGTSSPDLLIASADEYTSRLDPEWAKPLNTELRADAISQDFIRLAQQLPDYTTGEELAQIETDTSSHAIRSALQDLKNYLQTPEGLLAASSARSDPLDWTGRTVRNFLDAVASFGYRAVLEQDHLMDRERRHLLLVLKTPVLMTDTVGSRDLLEHLHACAEGLPPSVEVNLVCGHLHTLGNEEVIRRDVRITAIAIITVFIFLFMGVYRDVRAIGIMLIPFLASIPALALSGFIFGEFSFIVLGFGSVIAGIAVDFGIHTYVTARGKESQKKLLLIRRPVALSALTTLCVFIAFCFSRIPAYRQLGVFASIAILFSLVYAFWVLPLFIREQQDSSNSVSSKQRRPDVASPGSSKRLRAKLVVGFAWIGLLVGLVMFSSLTLETDLMKLDGTPQSTLDEENRAMGIWGGGESMAAILCVNAEDEKLALRLNDQLYAELLKDARGNSEIFSLSPIGPSDETRRVRRQNWKAYWTDERIEALNRNLQEEGEKLDFSAEAFQPFMSRFDEWLQISPDAATEPIGFLEPLRGRFIHPQEGRVLVTTFIPDDPQLIASVKKFKKQIPSLQVVSRKAFSDDLSESIIHEVTKVTLLALGLILVVTGLMIRRPGMIFFSGIPAMAGLLWGGAGMALSSQPLNISNMIAGILVLGLCVDYGICMTYAHQRGMQREVFRAVTLSALTTVLGAGVLLLAHHPAFFSMGITLVFGVSAGYLYAWLVLPAFQMIWPHLNPPENDVYHGGEGHSS